jgi:hypothetical protein
MDSIDGWATYSGAARILGVTYWQVVTHIKKNNIPTVKLTGSPTVLVKLNDLAGLINKEN